MLSIFLVFPLCIFFVFFPLYLFWFFPSVFFWFSSSVKWNDDKAKGSCTSNSLLQKHQKIKPFISNAALLHDQKHDCSHFTKTSPSPLSSSLFHFYNLKYQILAMSPKNRTDWGWDQRFNANEQILNVFSSDRKQIQKPTPSPLPVLQ